MSESGKSKVQKGNEKEIDKTYSRNNLLNEKRGDIPALSFKMDYENEFE